MEMDSVGLRDQLDVRMDILLRPGALNTQRSVFREIVNALNNGVVITHLSADLQGGVPGAYVVRIGAQVTYASDAVLFQLRMYEAGTRILYMRLNGETRRAGW
jgi:hypothetical protein